MRASVRLGLRVAAIAAFAATAALAVTLTRSAPMNAALTSAKHAVKAHVDGTPQCAGSGLRVWVGTAAGTGTARAVTVAVGSRRSAARVVTRYRLEFTNLSGAPCSLSGYPGVAAYRGDGAQVGNAAGRDTSVAARRVVLAPGASAHAAVVASVSRGPCRPVVATGLRVVPPGQSVARYVRHALPACSAAGSRAPLYLRVRAVEPGAGAPSQPSSQHAAGAGDVS